MKSWVLFHISCSVTIEVEFVLTVGVSEPATTMTARVQSVPTTYSVMFLNDLFIGLFVVFKRQINNIMSRLYHKLYIYIY